MDLFQSKLLKYLTKCPFKCIYLVGFVAQVMGKTSVWGGYFFFSYGCSQSCIICRNHNKIVNFISKFSRFPFLFSYLCYDPGGSRPRPMIFPCLFCLCLLSRCTTGVPHDWMATKALIRRQSGERWIGVLDWSLVFG